MNIPKSLLALCGDSTRGCIQHVYVDVEKKVAVATDGHALVQYPIEPEEGEVSGYVPAEAILAAAKLHKSLRGTLRHEKDVTYVQHPSTPFPISFPNPFQGEDPQPKYPQYEAVFPDESSLPITIAFNAQLMLDLAKTMSPNTVITLSLDPENYAMRAKGSGGTGAIGVIMGCRP